MNTTTLPALRTATPMKTLLAGLLALMAAAALTMIHAGPASASTLRYWTGKGADANWTNPANWDGSTLPATGDNLMFGSGGLRKTNVNDFPADKTFGSITFADTGYNLTGNRVRLTGGIATYHDSPMALADTVSLPVLVGATQSFNATAADHSVTYKGALALAGNVTFTGPGSQTVTGTVTGAGAITSDQGRLTLAGTNSGTGTTKVAGGTVVVTGNYASRSVVESAGSLEGSGTVGPVNVIQGYVVPRTSAPTPKAALLTVAGNLKMTTAGIYQVVVNGSAAGQYGRTTVSGSVSLADTPLAVDSAYRSSAITVGQVMTILKNTGPSAVSGIFDDAPEGSTVTDRSDARITYRISYKGGAGHDVILTVLTTGPVVP
jgi:hypothetical protein